MSDQVIMIAVNFITLNIFLYLREHCRYSATDSPADATTASTTGNYHRTIDATSATDAKHCPTIHESVDPKRNYTPTELRLTNWTGNQIIIIVVPKEAFVGFKWFP